MHFRSIVPVAAVAVALTLSACDPDAGTAAPPPAPSRAASPTVDAAAQAKAAAKKEAAAKAAADKKAEEKASAKAAAEKKAKAAAAKKAATGWTVTYVVDGDTVDVAKGGKRERIRVAGIDTPERGECGYAQATDHMINLVYGKTVTLSTTGKQDNRDRYGRLIRYLDVGKTDAGYRQIKDGYAIARYDSRDGYGWHAREDRYVSADKASGKAYTCSTPKPTPPPPTKTTTNASCDIKGNIASDGERIYHLPGGNWYDVTKIDLSKGERWFCSETEAVNAGWRAAIE